MTYKACQKRVQVKRMPKTAFAGLGNTGNKSSVARKTDNTAAKAALGVRIREARERAGLDQFQLAVEIGKRPEQISRWEGGQQMPGAGVVAAARPPSSGPPTRRYGLRRHAIAPSGRARGR